MIEISESTDIEVIEETEDVIYVADVILKMHFSLQNSVQRLYQGLCLGSRYGNIRSEIFDGLKILAYI